MMLYILQYGNQKAIITVYKQKDCGPLRHTSIKDKNTRCPKILELPCHIFNKMFKQDGIAVTTCLQVILNKTKIM